MKFHSFSGLLAFALSLLQAVSAQGQTAEIGATPPAGTQGTAGPIPKLGVYQGNFVGVVDLFQDAIGAPVAYGDAHLGRNSLSDIEGSAYNISISGFQGPMAAAVPLIWAARDGSAKGSLKEAASGAYDSTYYNAAKHLIADNNPKEPLIPVRIGWEFNHSFQPWGIIPGSGTRTDQTAAQLAADYVTAFRRAVTQFRKAASDANAAGRSPAVQFQIIWCMNNGDYDPRPAYPGDSFVDRIGTDFYWNADVRDWYGTVTTDPLKAWSGVRDRPWGLKWAADFAAGRVPLVDGGTSFPSPKPLIVAEWGVNNDAFGPFVTAAVEWAKSRNVESMAWWDSDAAYASQISTNTKPHLLAALRHAFNPGQYPTTAIVPVAVVPNKLVGPAITGLRQSGAVLIASPGVWGKFPSSFAYQWHRHGTAIPGATTNTYTLVDADVGQPITVSVVARNAAGASASATSASAGTIYAAVTNNPDIADYLPSDYRTADLTSGSWIKDNSATIVTGGAPDLLKGSTAQLWSENTTSTTSFKLRRTDVTKAAGTRYRKLWHGYFKAAGRNFVRLQVSTADYSGGFSVFFDLNTGKTNYSGAENPDKTTEYVVNRATAVRIGDRYRLEVDYYTDKASAGMTQQLFLATGPNDFQPHAGVVGQGVIVSGVSQVDATGTLPVQNAVPANTAVPVVWAPDQSAGLVAGQVLSAFYGAWTNQPTSFAYQWKRNGKAIPGATSSLYTAVPADAGQRITVTVIPVNTIGRGSAATSDDSINDGIDHSQQWLTTVNNPTKLPPVDAAAAPAFGTLVAANGQTPVSNVFAMDFTPGTGANKINTRAALDSTVFYNSMNGDLTKSIGSPMDDPTSGASHCRMRHYPAGTVYDLHTFTADGLKLGVVGKNNGTIYSPGNCYAGGIRLEPEWRPGRTVEFRFKYGKSDLIWMPMWAFANTQISPGRVPEAHGNPNYVAPNGAKLFNRLTLASNGRPDHFNYMEHDFRDGYTNGVYRDAGRSLTAGVVTYKGEYASPDFKFYPYTTFLANDKGFSSKQSGTYEGYRYTELSSSSLSDGKIHTLTASWRADGSNILDYMVDGKLFMQQYQEFFADTYTDIYGRKVKGAMHIIVGGQAIPSFAPGASDWSKVISDRDSLSMTVASIKMWDGVIAPSSIIVPANAFPPLKTPTLSDTVAYADRPFSATIGNRSKLRQGATVYTATADDGTPLSVSGTTLSGTFTGAGTRTISVTETPQPTANSGLAVAYGGIARTTTFSLTVKPQP